MKAAVIHKFGEAPRYEDFCEPKPQKDEVMIDVQAVVLENVNKMMANGTHYSSAQFFPEFPAIVGHAGVGISGDGKVVGFGKIRPPFGAFAEKVAAGYTVPVPDGIDPAVAAALPSSALTSLLPLMHTAKLEKGESVLINGATGVSGKIAVQVAKMLGAGRVTGTGRNETILNSLVTLGADAVINLKQQDRQLAEAFETGGEYDVIIDFLWGHPAEVLMKTIIPKTLGFSKKRIRYIQVGEKAGATISLPAASLRTSGLEIYGTGNISQESIAAGLSRVWKWMKENKLHMDIERVPLAEIGNAWQRQDLEGRRLVIIP